MRRPLLWGLVCAVGVAASFASAAEPVRRKALERRAAVERALDQPLDWDLGDREKVTLKELIAHVREQHGLSIRWDAATFQMLGGGAESLFGLGAQRSGSSSVAYFPQGGQCPPGMVCPAPLASAPVYAPPSTFAAPVTIQSYAGPQNVAAPAAGTALTDSPEGLPEAPQPLPAAAAPTANPDRPASPAELPPASAKSVVPVATQSKKRAAAPDPGAAPIDSPPTAPGEVDPLQPPLPGGPVPPPVGEASAQESDDDMPLQDRLAGMPVSRSALSLENASIEEALRQMLEAVMPPMGGIGEDLGVPIVTRAMTLDYLIEGNSVVITTHLQANSRKETRVYRIGDLKNLPPESLARVITHSVRPWSWRTQATEIAERLASRWPKGNLSLPMVKLDGLEVIEGIKLNSLPIGASPDGTVQPAGGTSASPGAASEITDEAVAATAQLLAGGAVATVQSIVAALEIVHHGDPPTGVIEALPGMLIVTQSQGAHREIADLLEELREASDTGPAR